MLTILIAKRALFGDLGQEEVSGERNHLIATRQGGICLEAIDPHNTSLNWTVVLGPVQLIITYYFQFLLIGPNIFTKLCASNIIVKLSYT